MELNDLSLNSICPFVYIYYSKRYERRAGDRTTDGPVVI